MAALSGATQLTPLFPTYIEKRILSSFTLTLVFAIYVVGALGMMWLGGSLSRKFGRKLLLGAALAAAEQVGAAEARVALTSAAPQKWQSLRRIELLQACALSGTGTQTIALLLRLFWCEKDP